MKKTVIQATVLTTLSVALIGAIGVLAGAIPVPGMNTGGSTEQSVLEDSAASQVGQAKVERSTISTQVSAPGEVKPVSTEKLKLDKNRQFKELVAPLNTRITKGTPLVNYTWGNPLVAPYDMVLTEHNVPAKSNENPTDENYLQVSRVDSMNIDIPVNEASISQVQVSQAAQVKPGAFPDVDLEGSVCSINQVGSYQSAGSRYTVTVNVANSDGRLLIGMSAQVAIKTAEATDVLSVPVSAIYRNGEQTMVHVLKSDGQIEEKQVTCGVSDGKKVEISGDINEGDTVQTAEVGGAGQGSPLAENTVSNTSGSAGA